MRGAAAVAVALLLAACGGEQPRGPTYNLILDAQGVVFVGSDATYARFPFGTGRAELERAAATVYGSDAARRSAGTACATGPMDFTSYGPIQLAFRQDELVGWTIRAGAHVATRGSIAPGITRTALERLTTISMVPDPALPGKFVYRTPSGPIQGVLTGGTPEAKVDALFAGTNCLAA